MNKTEITTMKVGVLYEGVTDGSIISDIELQRDIVYDGDKQSLVIDSLMSGVPLPAFYFWLNSDGVQEVLDGKQRIEAIRKFRQNDLPLNGKIWKELDKVTQERFNDTELSVIVCQGEESLKREIFRRINTLGVALNQFEVLNGLYHGDYLVELSDYANRSNVAAVFGNNSRGKHQVHILNWLLLLDGTKPTKENVSDYVKARKDKSFLVDKNRIHPYMKFVKEIFTDMSLCDMYFELALDHVKDQTIWRMHRDAINAMIRSFKKSDDWKLISDRAGELEDRILAIVGNISVDPKRLFTADDKKAYEATLTPVNGKYQCAECKQYFTDDELTMDHVTPWSKGGRTVLSNAQFLCGVCNSKKGNRV